MRRINRLRPEFVTYIPEDLADGVMYVSLEYRVAVHGCCCGCGERVVTPLNPAQWAVTYDGENVSLNPSIGGGRCNSHYLLSRGRVRWATPLTEYQRRRAAERDEAALQFGIGMEEGFAAEAVPAQANATPWWRDVLARLSSMTKRR